MKNNIKQINFNHPQKGFTLVEALVAISIFTVSLLAIISLLANGISNTNYAKTKLVSAYLAQEGIEYMRNMRDTYVLYDAISSQNGWTSFNNKLTGESCQLADGCYFGDLSPSDFTDSTQPIKDLSLTACSSTCPQLKYDSTTGKYGYASGSNSGYIRKIKSEHFANETKVTSTVYWTQGSGSYNIVFTETLSNWIE